MCTAPSSRRTARGARRRSCSTSRTRPSGPSRGAGCPPRGRASPSRGPLPRSPPRRSSVDPRDIPLPIGGEAGDLERLLHAVLLRHILTGERRRDAATLARGRDHPERGHHHVQATVPVLGEVLMRLRPLLLLLQI